METLAAGINLEFLQDDNYLVECLQEADQIASSNSIKGLFCNIILNCNPTKPEVLFNLFSEPMTEDFLRRCQLGLGADEVF